MSEGSLASTRFAELLAKIKERFNVIEGSASGVDEAPGRGNGGPTGGAVTAEISVPGASDRTVALRPMDLAEEKAMTLPTLTQVKDALTGLAKEYQAGQVFVTDLKALVSNPLKKAAPQGAANVTAAVQDGAVSLLGAGANWIPLAIGAVLVVLLVRRLL